MFPLSLNFFSDVTPDVTPRELWLSHRKTRISYDFGWVIGIFLVFWTKITTFWVPWRPVLGPNERGCCEKPFCSDLPRILCAGPSPTIKTPEFQSFFGFFTVFWCFLGRKIRFLRTFGDRCWVPTNGGALKHYFAVIYHEYCTHPPSYPPKYTICCQNRFLTIFF